jgi:hypothetical protein
MSNSKLWSATIKIYHLYNKGMYIKKSKKHLPFNKSKAMKEHIAPPNLSKKVETKKKY